MMKRILNTAKMCAALVAALAAFSACHTEEMADTRPATESRHTYRLEWSDHMMNPTRAAGEYPHDGDRVYLSFHTPHDYWVRGVAQYHAASAEWTLRVFDDGHLAAAFIDGEGRGCEAYYFLNEVSATDTDVTLNEYSEVYNDEEGAYSKTGDVVRLTSHLAPASPRVRFRGTPGAVFTLSGPYFPATMSVHDDEDSEYWEVQLSGTPRSLIVGEDGYTPYVNAFPYFQDMTISHALRVRRLKGLL